MIQYPRKTDQDRPWLPGPPPLRRCQSMEDMKPADLQNDRGRTLGIPVRKLLLSPLEHKATYDSITRLPRSQPNVSKAFDLLQEVDLYHGCSAPVSPALLQSFATRGPSICYSRPKSYFSRQPAVYWTDSLEFALAWCVFTKTGCWTTYASPNFECVLYRSRVRLKDLNASDGCYVVPLPSSILEEQCLTDVSKVQLSSSGEGKRA